MKYFSGFAQSVQKLGVTVKGGRRRTDTRSSEQGSCSVRSRDQRHLDPGAGNPNWGKPRAVLDNVRSLGSAPSMFRYNSELGKRGLSTYSGFKGFPQVPDVRSQILVAVSLVLLGCSGSAFTAAEDASPVQLPSGGSSVVAPVVVEAGATSTVQGGSGGAGVVQIGGSGGTSPTGSSGSASAGAGGIAVVLAGGSGGQAQAGMGGNPVVPQAGSGGSGGVAQAGAGGNPTTSSGGSGGQAEAGTGGTSGGAAPTYRDFSDCRCFGTGDLRCNSNRVKVAPPDGCSCNDVAFTCTDLSQDIDGLMWLQINCDGPMQLPNGHPTFDILASGLTGNPVLVHEATQCGALFQMQPNTFYTVVSTYGTTQTSQDVNRIVGQLGPIVLTFTMP